MKPLDFGFEEKVDYSGAAAGSSCWEWIGRKTTAGYGQVTRKNKGHVKDFYAHRISYERSFGKIPEGLLVCHRCDNPSCVRPDHLFLGTAMDNHRDSVKKRRHSPPPHLVGQYASNAKLSDADAEFIRQNFQGRRAGYGLGNCAELARRFGVSMAWIYGIAKRGKRKTA